MAASNFRADLRYVESLLVQLTQGLNATFVQTGRKCGFAKVDAALRDHVYGSIFLSNFFKEAPFKGIGPIKVLREGRQ